MSKSAVTPLLLAPVALLLAAIPSTPAAATKAGEAAAACKKSSNCVGAWAPNGGWTGIVLTGDPDAPVTVTCPPNKDCFLERRGVKRGANVLGALKPSTGGLKQPSSGQAGPKKTGAPSAGVKLPTGFKQPTGEQPSASSGKRR
jgi:hypothetical protein